MPMVLIKRPTAPEIKPLSIDLPASDEIMVKPKMPSHMNSGEPKRKEKRASGCATKIKMTVLIVPPTKEANTAAPKALPALPFLVIS